METLECVLVRSDNEAVVVNLDIEPVEEPSLVRWVDPIHAQKARNKNDSTHSEWIAQRI